MPDNTTADCIFCDPQSPTFSNLLHETPRFRVVCDSYPLTEGHLLIIPRQHVSCVGAYSKDLFKEFLALYSRFQQFIRETYGPVSTFEHGVFGQTVFHSHVHILPYRGTPQAIVPEGEAYYRNGAQLEDLSGKLRGDGGYLFFTIGDKTWLVNPTLKQPRFFRDRFARALGAAERMDWRAIRTNLPLVEQLKQENQNVLARWKKFE